MFNGKKLTEEILATIKSTQLREKLAEVDRAALVMVYLNNNTRFVTSKVYKDKVTVNVPTLGIYSYQKKEDAVADQRAVDKILSAAKAWAIEQINK